MSSAVAAPQGALYAFFPKTPGTAAASASLPPMGTPFPLPLLPVDGGLLHHRASDQEQVCQRQGLAWAFRSTCWDQVQQGVGVRWLASSQSPGCRE